MIFEFALISTHLIIAILAQSVTVVSTLRMVFLVRKTVEMEKLEWMMMEQVIALLDAK